MCTDSKRSYPVCRQAHFENRRTRTFPLPVKAYGDQRVQPATVQTIVDDMSGPYNITSVPIRAPDVTYLFKGACGVTSE